MTGDRPLRARFASEWTSIARKYDGAKVSFRAASIGRDAKRAALPVIAEPSRIGDRVQFTRNEVVEWYEQTTNGIEQGFTIEKRPSGSGHLQVDIAVDEAMKVTPSRSPTELLLTRRSDDAPCFKYGALSVKDASGTAVPASMSALGESMIRIDVEDANASYPITIDPLVWALQTKLTRLEAKAQDQLGRGVALVGGNTIVAGMASYQDFTGAAAIFERSGAGWVESPQLLRGRLLPDVEPPTGFESFGFFTKASGDRILVGSLSIATSFRPLNGKWAFEGELTPPLMALDTVPIALSGDTAAVFVRVGFGSYDADAGTYSLFPDWEDGGAARTATVFPYRRQGATWLPETSLALPTQPSYALGALALDGDTLAVGIGDHVYVYRRTNGVWSLEATMVPDEGPGLFFGSTLLLEKDTLIVFDAHTAASVFERVGSTWSRTQKIVPPESLGNFGTGAALYKDVFFASHSRQFVGAEIVRFRRAGKVWMLEESILPDDLGAFVGLGDENTVATDGKTVVIADWLAGVTRGKLYVYELRGSLGDTCNGDVDCHSSHCVDGVCCDSACGGGQPNDCLVCDRADRRGACSAAPTSTICRTATSECDRADSCDGQNLTCPADQVFPNGTGCSGGSCVNGACRAAPMEGSSLDAGPALTASPSKTSCSMGAGEHEGRATFGIAALVMLFALARRRTPRRLVACAFVVSLAVRFESDQYTSKIVLRDDDGLIVTVSDGGATFRREPSGAEWTLALQGIGRSDSRISVERPRIEAASGQIMLLRRGLIETYERTAHGIEQTFIIDERPPGTTPLVLELAVTGARPQTLSQGHIVLTANEESPFHFGAARTKDASGHELYTSLHATENTIELTIEDRFAQYPIVIDPLVWQERQRFVSPGAPEGAGFGNGIRLAADVALVREDLPTRIDVFGRTGNAWAPQGYLPLPPDTGPALLAVLKGNEAFVSDGLTNEARGAVYVLDRVGASFTYRTKITAPNAQRDDVLGRSIAVDGNTLVAGAYHYSEPDIFNDWFGKVHVFERTSGTWSETAVLSAADPESRHFGIATAISGSTMLVAATTAVFEGLGAVNPRPTVFFYERSPNSNQWTLVKTEHDPDPRGGNFGDTVSIDGDTAIIAGPFPRTRLGEPKPGGSTYVYKRIAGEWQLTQDLRASDSATYDIFGPSILRGNRILVAAVGGNEGRGAFYLFERADANSDFVETRKFIDPEGQVGDLFASGDFSGDFLLLGAPGKNKRRGEIVFYYLGQQGEPCVNGDKCASGLCVDGVCCNSACGGDDKNDCLACSMAAGAKVDGTCGVVVDTSRTCRPKRDECDVAETCDGQNANCPADVFAANGNVCGGGRGLCVGGACRTPDGLSAIDAGPQNAASGDGGGCATASNDESTSRIAAIGLGVGVLALLRRARRTTKGRTLS